VIIADTRSSTVVANVAAAVGCAFDFDVDSDFCSHSGGQMSGEAAAASFNSAHQRPDYGA
jgi:hypothetical protein